MRWYVRPEEDAKLLRLEPRLACWNKASDPEQVRLQAYLDDAEDLLADSSVAGPCALRLDVGLAANRDLIDTADLDNYAYPLAHRLGDRGLVSVWCTKQHERQSLVRLEPAREASGPVGDIVIAETTASTQTKAYKEQIRAAVADTAELAPGPVRLELSFVVGPARNWLNLWKPTIDALDPLLGRTRPDRLWHPRDGRIVELGMHLMVDPAARYDIKVGIVAGQAAVESVDVRRVLRTAAQANGWEVHIDEGQYASDTYQLSDQRRIEVNWAASGGVLMAVGSDSDDRAGRTYIWRGDDPRTKTARVLTALAARTVVIPQAPEGSQRTAG